MKTRSRCGLPTDQNLIPLRIKTELMVGSLKADITAISGERHFLSSKLR
jgi:hypothetical protein